MRKNIRKKVLGKRQSSRGSPFQVEGMALPSMGKRDKEKTLYELRD